MKYLEAADPSFSELPASKHNGHSKQTAGAKLCMEFILYHCMTVSLCYTLQGMQYARIAFAFLHPLALGIGENSARGLSVPCRLSFD